VLARGRGSRPPFRDDTPAALEALSVSLQGHGYHITTATNGPDALELARSLDPDLILLDVMMPGMSGFEVCRALRDDPALAEVPVLLVTPSTTDSPSLRGSRAEPTTSYPTPPTGRSFGPGSVPSPGWIGTGVWPWR
jgi:CheY-like chemotaxis protein